MYRLPLLQAYQNENNTYWSLKDQHTVLHLLFKYSKEFVDTLSIINGIPLKII